MVSFDGVWAHVAPSEDDVGVRELRRGRVEEAVGEECLGEPLLGVAGMLTTAAEDARRLRFVGVSVGSGSPEGCPRVATIMGNLFCVWLCAVTGCCLIGSLK